MCAAVRVRLLTRFDTHVFVSVQIENLKGQLNAVSTSEEKEKRHHALSEAEKQKLTGTLPSVFLLLRILACI